MKTRKALGILAALDDARAALEEEQAALYVWLDSDAIDDEDIVEGMLISATKIDATLANVRRAIFDAKKLARAGVSQ